MTRAAKRAVLVGAAALCALALPATTVLTAQAALVSTSESAAEAAVSAPRSIVVSLEERRLWLVEGADTLLDAPVAIGMREPFRYEGRTYEWATPTGERSVVAKRPEPVWTVPEWHYYERAANAGLKVVKLVEGEQYPLADGSHLEVRGSSVVRVREDRYWRVPRGREIVIGGVLYVPPVGTTQRRVPGALGTRALDLGDGYLIHGTTKQNAGSIGDAASHGCIRMHRSDIERLYELVDTGTPVVIH